MRIKKSSFVRRLVDARTGIFPDWAWLDERVPSLVHLWTDDADADDDDDDSRNMRCSSLYWYTLSFVPKLAVDVGGQRDKSQRAPESG